MIRILKQNTTHSLWLQYENILQKHDWKQHIFWSDGYFVCSMGEVSLGTIQKYIEAQG